MSYSSTFTGDESPLSEGGVWIKSQSDAGPDVMEKISGAARADSATNNVSYYYNDLFANNQYSEGVIGSIGGTAQFIAVAVRMSGSGATACYYALYVNSANWYAVKLNNDVEDSGFASSGARTNIAGDTIRIEATGTTIVGLINGTQVFSKTDSALSSGKGGIAGAGTDSANATLTSWNAGDLGGGETVTMDKWSQAIPQMVRNRPSSIPYSFYSPVFVPAPPAVVAGFWVVC